MATLKQQKAFKEAGVNGGNISQAMKTAGYSESVSKRTDKLTNTKGWQELVEEYLPDSELARVHQEGLRATNIDKPDFSVRHKYLDTAYKLKGSYAPERKDVNVSIDPERKEVIEKALNEVL